jgi:hypothetical protein
MLSAHDFAKVGVQGSEFAFTVDGTRMVAKLREIADNIEAAEKGEPPENLRFAIQSVTVESAAAIDEFTFTTLHIRFAERVKAGS